MPKKAVLTIFREHNELNRILMSFSWNGKDKKESPGQGEKAGTQEPKKAYA